MHIRPRILLPTLAALLVASGAAAQGACALEYRRADTMWADWGRADGNLGTETITVQPGQKKVFATDWSYEKQRNDGSNYYGSHLRQSVNRGGAPVVLVLRGPGQFLHKPRIPVGSLASALSTMVPVPGVPGVKAFARPVGIKTSLAQLVASLLGSSVRLEPGDSAYHRHDLAEVVCPDAVTTTSTATAPPPEPPPPTVLLSVTGTPATLTTTTLSVTVQAQEVATGAPLSGTVTINGVTGSTGQALSYTRCTETVEFEDTRGVTRTRTLRVPCVGTVQISGHPDTYFRF